MAALSRDILVLWSPLLFVSFIDWHHDKASKEADRMLSTRPSRNRRVEALSYVDTKLPCNLEIIKIYMKYFTYGIV